MSSQKIYLVDEDRTLLKTIAPAIENAFKGLVVEKYYCVADATSAIKKHRPVCVVTHLEFPEEGASGMEFVENILSDQLTSKIAVVVTGNRAVLEESKAQLEQMDLEQIPKAIKIPALLETLKKIFKRADEDRMEVVNIKAGEFLFREGEKSDSMYVLNNGKLRIFKNNEGVELDLAEVSQQQLIGEMAFLDGLPRSASIQALEDSELLKLKLGDFQTYLEKQPYWLNMILKTLLHRLRKTSEHLSKSI